MIKNVIAFGASNSKQSVNQQFAQFTASKLRNTEAIILNLNDFELPIYSIDLEKKSGIPTNAIKFSKFIKESHARIISLAEHNGLYNSAFKNLWDWISRIDGMNIWGGKPMFLLSTSPSKKERNYVMKVSLDLFPAFGANIIASYVLPSFNHYFKEHQIIEENHAQNFESELHKFQEHINQI